MYDLTRTNLDSLLALVDTLESSAFRWGSICSDPAADQVAWDEGLQILRNARHALRRAIGMAWAVGMTGGPLTPIHDRLTHLDCDLRYSPIGGISICDAHGAYVLTDGSPAVVTA
ncbi:MAG TPA: hypothetical protein VK176_03615 [Phycisphaerales bacterium]|nr:hypothetical protein [Phycisphaerales bacterium]